MTIVVLDYSDPCVNVFRLPDDYFEQELEDGENLTELIEEYLVKQGLKSSEINWMVSDETVPVYYENSTIPTTSL